MYSCRLNINFEDIMIHIAVFKDKCDQNCILNETILISFYLNIFVYIVFLYLYQDCLKWQVGYMSGNITLRFGRIKNRATRGCYKLHIMTFFLPPPELILGYASALNQAVLIHFLIVEYESCHPEKQIYNFKIWSKYFKDFTKIKNF